MSTNDQASDISPWFHGSPLKLTSLRAGSTITQDRRLAEIFSHKPRLVSVEDDGMIRHNGTETGYLYLVSEPLQLGDVVHHPHSTMPDGWEWVTTRELPVIELGFVPILPEERL
jgi:hypothetical protein